MLRYYMTPETQQALIAESNRMIARRSLTRNFGNRRGGRDASESSDFAELGSESGSDACTDGDAEDSAFARLVADLQSVSAVSHSQ